jgi:hypothetical protein
MFVVCHRTGGQPVMANNEHAALTWFTIAEACALDDLALEDCRAVLKRITS